MQSTATALTASCLRFLFLPCYYCWYSTILIIVISANVLLLLLLQHFFTNYEFSECVVFEHFSPKASQYDFHLIPRWKMQTVKVLD